MIFKIEIRGVVQGVGFRPFIYNLANSLNLNGYVLNNGYGVLIEVEAKKEELELFIQKNKRWKTTFKWDRLYKYYPIGWYKLINKFHYKRNYKH